MLVKEELYQVWNSSKLITDVTNRIFDTSKLIHEEGWEIKAKRFLHNIQLVIYLSYQFSTILVKNKQINIWKQTENHIENS